MTTEFLVQVTYNSLEIFFTQGYSS
jgi:hypothetical protein